MSQRIIEWFWGFVNVFRHHTPGPISSAGAFVVNAGPTSCVAFSAGAVVSTGCTTADSEGAWVGAAVSCAFVVSPGPQGTVGTGVVLALSQPVFVPVSVWAVLPVWSVQVLLFQLFRKPW